MSKEWVDFKAVKQSVSMQMILEHYGINGLRKNGDELRGRCPIHKGEGERTFHVNPFKGVFNCFSCTARGNVIDLVAAMEHCSVRDAALKLQEWFPVGESEPERGRIHVKPEEHDEETNTAALINPPLPFQLRVDPGHDYPRMASREIFFG
jgi:DNA primase